MIAAVEQYGSGAPAETGGGKAPNEMAQLRAEAKALGINSFGKSKAALREEIAAAKGE